MHLSTAAIKQLKKQYPYAAPFLSRFVPMEEFCHKLIEEMPPPALPIIEEGAIGIPACRAEKENLNIYIDEHILASAKKICREAAKHIKEQAEGLKELATFLDKDAKACKHLASLALFQKKARLSPWAKKHAMQKDAAAIAATYIARCAALRIAKHAEKPQDWGKNYCSCCGSLPNAGYLQTKEGHRFLHCSLCSNTWRFSRTVCPACEDDKPSNRLIFNLEGGSIQQRAEGCSECKHYLLMPDIRDMAEDVPLAILLYCLVPMDILMQDQGYKPLESI